METQLKYLAEIGTWAVIITIAIGVDAAAGDWRFTVITAGLCGLYGMIFGTLGLVKRLCEMRLHRKT